MLIEVRTDGHTEGGDALAEAVKTDMRAALQRYGDRIRRIDVHLSGAVGNKTSHDDKSCMIEAHRDGHDPIVVTDRNTSMDQAIHGAVHKLKHLVDSALGKEAGRDHLRDH